MGEGQINMGEIPPRYRKEDRGREVNTTLLAIEMAGLALGVEVGALKMVVGGPDSLVSIADQAHKLSHVAPQGATFENLTAGLKQVQDVAGVAEDTGKFVNQREKKNPEPVQAQPTELPALKHAFEEMTVRLGGVELIIREATALPSLTLDLAASDRAVRNARRQLTEGLQARLPELAGSLLEETGKISLGGRAEQQQTQRAVREHFRAVAKQYNKAMQSFDRLEGLYGRAHRRYTA